jgi:protein ImuB
MLWIALHPAALSLEAFAATLGAAQQALPLALLSEHQVQAVNRVALQLGVQPGMKRATALALAPQLLFGQADAAREHAALQALAHAALAFTPSVTLQAATVLLEVQGSLRCFGGLQPLQQRLRAALAPLGFTVRLASAPTALGAALLARWGAAQQAGDLRTLRRQLDEAPVWLLGPGREHGDALQGMGLRTLGDLRGLPRSGLARRFGEALLGELDRARGDTPDPREWLLPPPCFDQRLELFERADSTAPLLHAAAVLLARLAAWARARQARIGGFTLAMRHEPRHRGDAPACTTLSIALASPGNDIAHLQSVLRERLARLQLPAPTLELRLRCDRLAQGGAANGELFATPGSAREGLLRLIERLQARLGEQRVCQPLRREDHRPEQATAWRPASAARMAEGTRNLAGAAGAARPAALPVRPVWLLPEPLPLPERRSQPLLDGRPLQLLAGPERIEAGWWDGAPAVRDYFVAAGAGGALLWIYSTRLPLAQPAGGGWFLHGRFG